MAFVIVDFCGRYRGECPQLALDVGGVHGAVTEVIELDVLAVDNGLDLFHAERRTCLSNFFPLRHCQAQADPCYAAATTREQELECATIKWDCHRATCIERIQACWVDPAADPRQCPILEHACWYDCRVRIEACFDRTVTDEDRENCQILADTCDSR